MPWDATVTELEEFDEANLDGDLAVYNLRDINYRNPTQFIDETVGETGPSDSFEILSTFSSTDGCNLEFVTSYLHSDEDSSC
jgi:hypothetical protein